MIWPVEIAVAVGVVALVLVIVLAVKLRSRSAQFSSARSDLQRYAPITNIEVAVAALQGQQAKAVAERDAFLAEDQKLRAELNAKYQDARATYERLRAEVSALEENVEDMSYGLYRPHFSFDTSDEFKRAIEHDVYARKKAMIRNGTAAVCGVPWKVGESEREGQRMVKQQLKLMLRAFNGEVDAATARVSWNNVAKMEERIRKSAAAINASGTVLKASISPGYLQLALDELRLTYECERKKQEEREEQRRIREQMREEERALREAERAQQEAATEEARFEKALEKARAEVEKATGEKLARVNEKMAELEQKLAEAHEKMQRAKSLAEMTRSGHVYVISNIGSFGERTYKIGMTRRLDPEERVQELGDASVPFPFDVHAMIYSDDAPTLENAFHREFADRRVNLVNLRKEYFEVTLEEIEVVARKQNVTVQFTKMAEAREYRETKAIRDQRSNGATRNEASAPEQKAVELFPTQLVG